MKLGTFKVHHIWTECVKCAFVFSMGFPATVHGAMYPIDWICCSKDLTKQFFLFPNLKKQLKESQIASMQWKINYFKGNHFDSDEEVILACDDWFSLKNRVFYSQGFFKVKQRWQKCVNSDGGYIEKE